jgi:hypothetical protein
MVLRNGEVALNYGRKILGAAAALCAVTPVCFAQPIPAFPGADGAAAYITGGRGGIVYHVTRLDSGFNDSQRNQPGSLLYGLNDANFTVGGVVQPRTIVFDVGGVFWLGRPGEDNGWDTQSNLSLGGHNVTIAGQTAPGGGVIFMGGGLKLTARENAQNPGGGNMILRNVTVAPGYGLRGIGADGIPDSYVFDGIGISGTKIMVDHVTVVYATDEAISLDERANHVTIQYSNISQGQNYPQADSEGGGNYTGHAFGALIQPDSNAVNSFHHNLFAHQKGRLPRVGTSTSNLTDNSVGGYNDFRNNVFYNWFSTGGSGASNQPSQNNFINNFWLAGPGGDDAIGGSNPGIVHRDGGTNIFNGSSATVTRVHHSGNLRDINKDGDPDDGVVLTNANFGSSSFQANPYTQVPYYGVTDAARDAFDRVLDHVGAYWWDRNPVDARIVQETRTGTGKIMAWADDPFNDDPNEGMEWRNMLALRYNHTNQQAPFTRPADWDTDGDGMPDHWERAHGLDPSVQDHNGDFDIDGYTNLEEYLNELAAWPAPRPLVFAGETNNRYAQITNWDITWQPSRYDEAQINSGTVLVDTVGQHAGTLGVASHEGNVAELQVVDGWLRVHEATVVGVTPTSQGMLHLSGGTLSTPILAKGAHGTFQFTGGTLHADIVTFDLDVDGGRLAPGNAIHTLAPGSSIGSTMVLGDLTIRSGEVEIEIGAAAVSDKVLVDGMAALGGTLTAVLVDGFVPAATDVFEILAADSVVGVFVNAITKLNISGGTFDMNYSDTAVILTNFQLAAGGLPGDLNGDGAVDAADYTAWRDQAGSVDAFNEWRDNFGTGDGPGAMSSSAAIPEPSSLGLLGLGLSLMATRRPLRSQRA